MTTISDLPKNSLEEILSRVPLNCLGEVRSTCKRWDALSKEKILCKGEARHQFLGFMMKKYKLCSMRFNFHGKGGDEFSDPSIKELGDFLNQVEISNVFQCDGLVLCVTNEDETRLVVWNPYLGQTRWIQPRSTYHRSDIYAIGYDNNRNHKILRFLDVHYGLGNNVFGYEIYDFSSSSWRFLDITLNLDIEPYERGASLKGNTYFFAKEKLVCEENGQIPETHHYLLCFDFTTERFGGLLPLPFHHYPFDAGALSSLRDEKLAALYQAVDISEVEIWVTTMIEPNAVSWIPFLKIDMKPHCGFGFMFDFRGGSFFVDEETKVAVVIHYDPSETSRYEDEDEDAAYIIGENGYFEMSRYEDAAYIIGENGYLKKVRLGDAPCHIPGSLNFSKYKHCCPLVSCCYVPSLVQVNQIAGFKKEKEEEEADQQAQKKKKTN